MTSSKRPTALPINSEEGGILQGENWGLTVSDLYNPETGKALLMPGVSINRPPPSPSAHRSGLIDSGVLPDHPQLRNLIVAMKDFTGDDPIDRIGHGTVVAIKLSSDAQVQELMEGNPTTLGLSPALLSAKVTDPTGKIELDHVIEAVHWLATQDVKLVSMSLAFLGKRERFKRLCEAIAHYETRITFFAAAGNFGPNVSAYPASCKVPNLVSLGALYGGQLWERSGMGDLYEDSELNLLPYYAYHHDLAQRLVQAGAYSRAREEYVASLAAELNAPALLGIALLDAHEGDLESAYTTLMRAKPLAPDDVEIEANLGGVLILQEREVDAKEHLDRAIELDPKNVRALTNRAIALARLSKPKRALEDLVEARALAKDTSKIDGMLELLRESGSL